MDETIAQRIVEAFEAIRNPYSSAETREAATAFVEEVKAQRECAGYMHHILGLAQSLPPDQADYVRFLR